MYTHICVRICGALLLLYIAEAMKQFYETRSFEQLAFANMQGHCFLEKPKKYFNHISNLDNGLLLAFCGGDFG